MAVLTELIAAASSADRWGDYPTWLAAIGTLAAVIVALYLAGQDSRRRSRQQRAHQAELITAWLTDVRGVHEHGKQQRCGIAILNGSQQLAYHVIATLVDVRGTAGYDFRERGGLNPYAFRAFVGELPPGRTDVQVDYPGVAMHIRWVVELAFKDAAGVTWVREADGRLKSIAGEPEAYYQGLHEPIDWVRGGPAG
jgi:hypothetical protein